VSERWGKVGREEGREGEREEKRERESSEGERGEGERERERDAYVTRFSKNRNEKWMERKGLCKL
jgi:hypothetical protein